MTKPSHYIPSISSLSSPVISMIATNKSKSCRKISYHNQECSFPQDKYSNNYETCHPRNQAWFDASLKSSTRIASAKSAKSVFNQSHNLPPCIAVFAKGMVYRPVGKVSPDPWWWMPLMHIVNLVHVRASEAFTITNSKHESYPTGCFYPVFFISLTSISTISQIRIQPIIQHPTLHSGFCQRHGLSPCWQSAA